MVAAINPGVFMEPHRKAILCLCYDTNMLHVRHMLLEHFGYKVLPASSVEDATSVARSQCPDMLLMDNSQPGIDYEQVASQLKRACPGMIAVILSPYYYGLAKGNGNPIDHYVAKDEGPDFLLSQIRALFGEQPMDDCTVRPM